MVSVGWPSVCPIFNICCGDDTIYNKVVNTSSPPRWALRDSTEHGGRESWERSVAISRKGDAAHTYMSGGRATSYHSFPSSITHIRFNKLLQQNYIFQPNPSSQSTNNTLPKQTLQTIQPSKCSSPLSLSSPPWPRSPPLNRKPPLDVHTVFLNSPSTRCDSAFLLGKRCSGKVNS